MKARKNVKRTDPRWHLEETSTPAEGPSNAAQQEKLNNKKDFHNFSFDSWLIQEKKSEEEYETELKEITVDMRAPRHEPADEDEYFPGGTVDDLPPEVEDRPTSSCGGKVPKMFFVDLGVLGKLEAPNLKDAVGFALHAVRNKLAIEKASPEVLAAIGGLSESDEIDE